MTRPRIPPATRRHAQRFPRANGRADRILGATRTFSPGNASPTLRSLVSDLDALRQGSGSPLAVADSAYLVMRDHLAGGSSLTLGAQVSTPRCPDCGRWMGDVHNCPVRRTQAAVPVPVIPVAPITPDPADLLPIDANSAGTETVEPPASQEIDTSPAPDAGIQGTAAFAHVLTNAFDKLGERLGDRLGERLGTVLGERFGDRPGEKHPTEQVASSASLNLSPVSPSPADDRMASALDRLATILQEWSHRVPIEPGRLAGEPEASSGRKRGKHGRLGGELEVAATEVTRPAPKAPVRPPLDVLPLTPQEHILQARQAP